MNHSYAGIDGSKRTLTVATSPETTVQTCPNTPDGGNQLLQAWRDLPLQRMVGESSGGYERGGVQALPQAGLPIVVVPPNRARPFARSLRPYLKTDAVDAQVLARFAQVYEPPAGASPNAAQQALQAVGVRRSQVVQPLEAEQQRLPTAPHPTVRASVQRAMEALQAE